jgi:hypothetical protein
MEGLRIPPDAFAIGANTRCSLMISDPFPIETVVSDHYFAIWDRISDRESILATCTGNLAIRDTALIINRFTISSLLDL